MKKQFHLLVFTLLLLGTSLISFAQEEPTAVKPKPPRWVSEKGYWMVESNIHQPRQSCVYFYTNDNVLVHKQNITGTRLKLNKTRTKMRLKKALESIMIAREAGKSIGNPEEWVASLLRR